MARYRFDVIKGERSLRQYCERRYKQLPLFVESFARNIPGVTIERVYERAPKDDQFCAYYIVYSETTAETVYCDISDIRAKVYEQIRTGNIKRSNGDPN